MMITERIEYDVKCLEAYFRQLFTMALEASSEEPSSVATSGEPEYFVAHNVAAFIRPDMVSNIYGLVDFWLAELCRFHERKGKPTFSKKKGKGDSDFGVYHRYLTKVAALPLQAAQPSYDYLDNLRKVRNCLIHGGGHTMPKKRIEIEKILGITVSGTLVIITDQFIWDSLSHAKVYLCAIAHA